MRKYLIMVKTIIIFALFTSLFGCSASIELKQDEVQIFEGQSISAVSFLSDELQTNEKVEIINNVDNSKVGEYEIIYKLGSSEETLKVIVKKNPLVLSESKLVIETGSEIDPKTYLPNTSKTYDIKINSNIDCNKPGEYIVIYSFSGLEKTLSVSVKDPEIILNQTTVAVDLGSVFEPRKYLGGDFPNSAKISFDSNVNTQEVGSYRVIYSLGSITKTLNVNVKDVSPILITKSVSIKEGSTFTPENYLADGDKTNSNIVINNTVNSKIPGTYLVTYQLNNIVKTLSVTVTKAAVVAPQPTFSLKVISLTSPVSAGSNATIVVQGQASKQYSITVYYKSGPSTAEGLYSKTADSSGRVSWTWKVGARTSSGSWKIVVSGGGKSLTTYFSVY